ncbi:MAG: 16S rRNA processing protein RimM [Alphaproteobacteria bacterium]|nr:16S rRNA processing protein RimM [Alphaproteobacteria bacterium]
MLNNNKILVGKIVAPQGIRGEVRIQTYSDAPMDFKKFNIISDKFKAEDFRFVRTIPNSTVIIAKINGFDDRNAAETLRGTELFIGREDLPDLGEQEYYQTDLIGLTVNQRGNIIGRVACIQNFGAGDILELENGDMVSFIGANVDMDARIIYVR